MRKKLVWSGNSAALVIDKTMLRLHGLKVGMYVDIETDGRTLVVQKSDVQDDDDATISFATRTTRSQEISTSEAKRVAMRAPEVFQALVQSWSIPFEVFRTVYHGHAEAPDPKRGPLGWVMSLGPYRHWVETDDRYDPSPAELATMRRFEVLYEEVRGRTPWDEAAQIALETVPMRRDDGLQSESS